MGLLTEIAYAALMLLVAVLAIYWTLRLLGKIAKFVVTVIIIVVVIGVLWYIFKGAELQAALPLLQGGILRI